MKSWLKVITTASVSIVVPNVSPLWIFVQTKRKQTKNIYVSSGFRCHIQLFVKSRLVSTTGRGRGSSNPCLRQPAQIPCITKKKWVKSCLVSTTTDSSNPCLRRPAQAETTNVPQLRFLIEEEENKLASSKLRSQSETIAHWPTHWQGWGVELLA